jgi:hypothetical protein
MAVTGVGGDDPRGRGARERRGPGCCWHRAPRWAWRSCRRGPLAPAFELLHHPSTPSPQAFRWQGRLAALISRSTSRDAVADGLPVSGHRDGGVGVDVVPEFRNVLAPACQGELSPVVHSKSA